jgi:hypothetical protein
MAEHDLHTPEYLRQRIAYDPETGILTWLERPLSDFPSERIGKAWNTRQVGNPAFHQQSSHGYRTGRLGGKNYYAHRVIWMIVYGREPANVDHINGDGWDNRLCNLRECSHAENLRNMKRNKRNTSGVTGVKRAHSRWAVQIGKDKFGSYPTMGEAAAVRRQLEHERGYSAGHGQPKTVRR